MTIRKKQSFENIVENGDSADEEQPHPPFHCLCLDLLSENALSLKRQKSSFVVKDQLWSLRKQFILNNLRTFF